MPLGFSREKAEPEFEDKGKSVMVVLYILSFLDEYLWNSKIGDLLLFE